MLRSRKALIAELNRAKEQRELNLYLLEKVRAQRDASNAEKNSLRRKVVALEKELQRNRETLGKVRKAVAAHYVPLGVLPQVTF